jgi:hypothetical protein
MGGVHAVVRSASADLTALGSSSVSRGCPRFLEICGARKSWLVSHIFMSWNRIEGWLRRIESLRAGA